MVNGSNACIGKIELQKVLPVHINDFYNNNLSRLSGKTKQIYHKVLNKAFKDAYKHQYINKNIIIPYNIYFNEPTKPYLKIFIIIINIPKNIFISSGII